MLQKQATYRPSPADLKFTIGRTRTTRRARRSERVFPSLRIRSALLTERESVFGPLHPPGPVGHLALHDGRPALGHVHVARPRPEELLLLRRRRRLAAMVAASPGRASRGDERGSGIASRT